MDVAPIDDPCGPSPTSNLGLRVGALFVILVTSLAGTLFPILSKRSDWMRRHVPAFVFEFAKFFGSGVILSTGFIHLLEPAADEELGPANLISAGGCIADSWGEYPYAFGICLASVFGMFVLQMVVYRVGSEKMRQFGIFAQQNTQPAFVAASQGGRKRSAPIAADEDGAKADDGEDEVDGPSDEESQHAYHDASEDSPAAAQLLALCILEFGIIFHSVIIGITLAVSDSAEFVTLFVVLIFHQMFEGLGLGARLAFLQLPTSMRWFPYAGAALYSAVTPLGMAIGLGIREGVAMSGGAASIASGIVDSISAGILIYTSLVELIAHEFIFNDYYKTCSWTRLWLSMGCFALGAGIMSLLGKWA